MGLFTKKWGTMGRWGTSPTHGKKYLSLYALQPQEHRMRSKNAIAQSPSCSAMCFGRLWCSDLITLVRQVTKLCSLHMEKTWPGNPPWWGTPPYMWMRSRKRERLSSPRLKSSRLRSPTYVWTGPNRFRSCHRLVQETAMFNMSLMGTGSNSQ